MTPKPKSASNSFPEISGYTLVEQLYDGSRTTVYRALERTQQRSVAIKVLQNEYPTFSELVQFRNQYAIASHLKISGIVRPLSLEAWKNGYALVMEDCQSISLQQYVQERSLEVKDILNIARQLAEILHQLHNQRVIHKDIKPANILIHPDTKQVKLIDFSISSLLPKETQEIQNPNILEGTLAYISPEQTGRMNRGIDYRTDFYSLGVTLYELVTGFLPFEGNDPMELIHSHIAKDPLSVQIFLDSQGKPHPEALGAIILKLMAKNAEDRYQSALGLKHDFQKCLSQWEETGTIEPFELGERDLCDRFLIPEKLYGREAEVAQLLAAFERVSQENSEFKIQNSELKQEFKGQSTSDSPQLPNSPIPHPPTPDSRLPTPSHSELVLVAGYSGVGKTAVINEVHKPIVRQRGYFIKGKFDQFNRNIPFSAFVQAFRDLMGQLLGESDAQLQQWKTNILQALGENGQVIISVIPELKRIIGEQPPVPALSGSAAQNRFNSLFSQFIRVFTTPEHPLVIFLDDLQWSDSASLNLLKVLMKETETGYLLVLGAYRDNEVYPAHPLMLALDEISKHEEVVNTITLAPLTQSGLNHLIADTLSCSLEVAIPLTELVYQKTQGNPFFATQFLKGLHEDGEIIFNLEAGYWQCNIAQVRQLSLTDDVVEFMADRLQKLPTETQKILQLAACVGNTFDLSTLAIVSEQSQEEVATSLWKTLQERLILPTNETYKFFQDSPNNRQDSSNTLSVRYKFLHDRVQQAAYSLIPEQEKQKTHLSIGQLLLSKIPLAQQEENIFEIVNQLNIGQELILPQTQREELAQLNLLAAKKAKASTAYQSAWKYCKHGISLLSKDCWQKQYDLILELYVRATESTYLNADFERTEEYAKIVIEEAHSLLDKLEVYEVQIQVRMAKNESLKAIHIALQVLKLLRVELPESPTMADIQTALQEVENLCADKSLKDFTNLPKMTDLGKIAALRILSIVIPPSTVSAPALFPLIVARQVILSVKYGNAPLSAYAYVSYGFLLCAMEGGIERGYEFGRLALRMLERSNSQELKSKILMIFNSFICCWKHHPKVTIQPLLEAYQSGLETGDLEFAGYSSINHGCNLFFMGENLQDLKEIIAGHVDFQYRIKLDSIAIRNQVFRQFILNLCQDSSDPCLLAGSVYDEREMFPIHQERQDGTAIFLLSCSKLVLCYLFNAPQQGLECAKTAERYLDTMRATQWVSFFYFYDSLTQLANCDRAPNRELMLERVAANQEKMEYWAHHAPMNFLHKLHLIRAEKHRSLDEKMAAMEWYDRAISGAKENQYPQEEALANELAAKFYLHWGKEKIAQTYMVEAYYGYARWGSSAKTHHLEQTYPQLLTPILQQQQAQFERDATLIWHSAQTSTRNSSTQVSSHLDFTTVLKASQAISEDIQLDRVLSTLMQVVLENAGADKGVLILSESNRWVVRAIATLNTNPEDEQTAEISTVLSCPLEENNAVPITLIRSVSRTGEPVIINDVAADKAFAGDAYFATQPPRSLLCVPFVRQGRAIGVLYLENQVAKESFTRDRVEVLNLLTSQAAISLENAQLYAAETEKTHQLQRLNSLIQAQQDAELDGILAIDEERNVVGCNRRFKELWAIPEEIIETGDDRQLLQHALSQLADPQAFLEKVEYLYEHPSEKSHSEVALKDGRIFERYSSPIASKTGESFGRIWCFRDISDRKQAEIQLKLKAKELEEVLNNLKQAQLQLVQNEKMATLGNLVAGVAHEINNPIGFVSGNITLAAESLQDLSELLSLYQEHYPTPVPEIVEVIEEIDPDYLLEDMPKLFSSMQKGADRIIQISQSMRTFSRTDTEQKIPANLHDGIDSTLLILKHRLKANDRRPAIEIIKNYGEIPETNCFPGQLNQVFMNILANAIDAFEDANQGKTYAEIEANPNCIAISTSIAEEQVKIQIRDNGCGMKRSIRERIFEQGFTTKDVGKGTGLGMAIAHQIVEEKHGGAIACHSEVGQGTTFIIALPLQA